MGLRTEFSSIGIQMLDENGGVAMWRGPDLIGKAKTLVQVNPERRPLMSSSQADVKLVFHRQLSSDDIDLVEQWLIHGGPLPAIEGIEEALGRHKSAPRLNGL